MFTITRHNHKEILCVEKHPLYIVTEDSNILGTRSKKKIVKFGDFVLNSLTPTLLPLIGTKKFRTICSAFGPPPSFMKLGQNGEKSCLFVVHLEDEMQE